jgi:hypothetical protein
VAQPAGDGTEGTADQLIDRAIKAAHDLDPPGLQAQLARAATVLGVAACVDEVAIPATREMSRLLAIGQCDGAQELMATEVVRTWLNDRDSHAPPPHEIEPILLACGPHDRHTITLEALALLLRLHRWPCRVLGARTTTFTLTIAAQAVDATGVVVISTDVRGRPSAVASLRAVDALGVPVFFTGDAFEPECGRREVPGRFLGTSVQGACALLIETLTPAVQRRSTFPRGPGSDVH